MDEGDAVPRPILKRRPGFEPPPGPALGRRRGSRVLLLRDKRRFEVATYFVFATRMGMSPQDSADMVVLLLGGRPIKAGTIDEFLVISGGHLHTRVRDRSDSLARKCDKIAKMIVAGEYPAADHDWLVESIVCLWALIEKWNDPDVVARALDTLVSRGWGGVLRSLFAELGKISTSNLPPVDDDMGVKSKRGCLLRLTKFLKKNSKTN